jgi:hypothetical protein
MPLRDADVMVPELAMPPSMVALLVMRIPSLVAEIDPAFDTVPVIVLLLIVMPVPLGGPWVVVIAP